MTDHQQPRHSQHSGYHTMPDQGNMSSTIYLGNPEFVGFDSKSIRSSFVTKVYSILSLQLVFTTSLIALFTFHDETNSYFRSSAAPIWLYSSLVLAIVVFMILVCVEPARRNTPINFILLILMTVGFSIVAAVYSAQYNSVTVLFAIGSTAVATISIMLLAKCSAFDMTTCGCGLCVLGLIHLVLTMVLILLVPLAGLRIRTATLILACMGAFLVSLYLMYDLQLIMGGRSMELSPEEYILGAVLLFVDIINIFQYMLIIFGSRD